MSIRPLQPLNLRSIDSVDDALAVLDASIDELMGMTKDLRVLDNREVWTLDKNILSLKPCYDKLEALVRRENEK